MDYFERKRKWKENQLKKKQEREEKGIKTIGGTMPTEVVDYAKEKKAARSKPEAEAIEWYVFEHTHKNPKAMRGLNSQSRATENYRAFLYNRFKEQKQAMTEVRRIAGSWLETVHHCNDDWKRGMEDEVKESRIIVALSGFCRKCGKIGNAVAKGSAKGTKGKRKREKTPSHRSAVEDDDGDVDLEPKEAEEPPKEAEESKKKASTKKESKPKKSTGKGKGKHVAKKRKKAAEDDESQSDSEFEDDD